MFNRREFVKSGLAGSTLLAFGSSAPGFLASTAMAAEAGKEKILVVVELTGGNDGLNTVIPHGDDLYYKARPKLGIRTKEGILSVDEHTGLNPALQHLKPMVDEKKLAAVLGVGYPNPNRSHFESMDVWHSADPTRRAPNGWLGRGMSLLKMREGHVPAFHISKQQLPLALLGSGMGIPTLHPDKPFDLQLAGDPHRFQSDSSVATDKLQPKVSKENENNKKRRKLIDELASLGEDDKNEMFQFVRRTSMHTYTSIEQLREILSGGFQKPQGQAEYQGNQYSYKREGLYYELQLVAQMIRAQFGTRIYYLALDGFDTHSGQRTTHAQLLQKLGIAIAQFFAQLKRTSDEDRVVLLTFSEFGRRVKENGSGTDHGAGSSLLVLGPAVKGGLVGEHPSLEPDKLDNGDLRFNIDFRQVYATVLDRWLECDSRRVLGDAYENVPLFA